MIRAAEIRNFKIFEDERVDDLRRINIIVGDNGVGKTAFLEALFMASANNAEVAQRFRVWRGLSTVLGSAQAVHDSMMDNLFRKFDTNRVGEIVLSGTVGDQRTLRFYKEKQEGLSLPLGEPSNNNDVNEAFQPVAFEWATNAGLVKTVPEVDKTGLGFPSGPPRRGDPTFLPARGVLQHQEIANWYSQNISIPGREKKFLSLVRNQFSEIQSISTESEHGSVSLHVKLKWMKNKIPVPLVSGGLNSLLSILLRLAHSEGTAVFVDEIENGFHYSRDEKLWSQFRDAAQSYNTQLFASSHSLEFIKSAIPTIMEYPKDFALIRIHRIEDRSKIGIVTGEEMLSVISSGLEFRR